MAIEISNAAHEPALNYNRIFMRDLHICQRMANADNAHPYYELRVEIVMYAVDSEGNRHYRNKTDTIFLEDYQAVAIQKSMAGDMDLVNAGTAIEAALARIIADQRPDLGEATVV